MLDLAHLRPMIVHFPLALMSLAVLLQAWLFWKNPISRIPGVLVTLLGVGVMALLLTTACYGDMVWASISADPVLGR